MAGVALASVMAVSAISPAIPDNKPIASEIGEDLLLEEVNAFLDVEIPHADEADLSKQLLITFPEEKKVVVPVMASARVSRLPETELDGLFAKYGEAYGVSPDKLKVIAYCESHYNSNAVNGPYLGMYQYLASTWISTRQAMGMDGDPTLRANAEESIRTTAWKIAYGGIGAWPVCGVK